MTPAIPTAWRARLARWARPAHGAGLALGLIMAATTWLQLTSTGGSPVDVRAYWAANPDALYPSGSDWRATGYLYSPAFELVIGWGRLLPFEVFAAIWRAVLIAAVLYLAGPLSAPVLLVPAVASEINAGNIQLLMAVAIVIAFRRPAAWAFVFLTKVTPGLALGWFVLRREWRKVAEAVVVTAVIAGVTFVIWPDRWFGFLGLVGGNPAPAVSPYYLTFWDRLPWVLLVLVIGAWRGWRWTIVVAATLALPVFYFISPSLLVGALPFARERVGRWLALEHSKLPAQAHSETDAMLGP